MLHLELRGYFFCTIIIIRLKQSYIYIVKSVLKCKKHKTKINEVEVDREVDQNRKVQQ